MLAHEFLGSIAQTVVVVKGDVEIPQGTEIQSGIVVFLVNISAPKGIGVSGKFTGDVLIDETCFINHCAVTVFGVLVAC